MDSDHNLLFARQQLKSDLRQLEETIQQIVEILDDNQILHEDPTKFFTVTKTFREQVRSIDMPHELSFMLMSGDKRSFVDRKANGKHPVSYPPGSVQKMESLLVESAYLYSRPL